MAKFKLIDISQYRNPRWPVMSGDDSLVLMGYAYARSSALVPPVTLATLERRSDLLMAVFCCGGRPSQVDAAIQDYVRCVQRFLQDAKWNKIDLRKIIVHTQDALLLALASKRPQLDPLAIARASRTLLREFTGTTSADIELMLWLTAVLGCCGVPESVQPPEVPSDLSPTLQGLLSRDSERFRMGLQERFATAFGYADIPPHVSRMANLLEKTRDYYRFGRGLVHVGLFEVARCFGIDAGDLRTAKEISPYVEVFEYS